MSIERGSSDFNCPLCSQSYSSASDLELHVNVEHEDILSPAKVSNHSTFLILISTVTLVTELCYDG